MFDTVSYRAESALDRTSALILGRLKSLKCYGDENLGRNVDKSDAAEVGA